MHSLNSLVSRNRNSTVNIFQSGVEYIYHEVYIKRLLKKQRKRYILDLLDIRF